MSKKMYFPISFVVVLFLACNCLAATLTWDNNLGAGNRRWDDAANWDKTGPASAPTAGDEVVIDDQYTDDGNGPQILTGMSAVCNTLVMGASALPEAEGAVLTMTGGTLTTGDYMAVSYDVTGSARFDISAGDVNIAQDLFIAYDGAANGTVNMSGGTMVVGEDIEIADYGSSSGTLNISGGVVEVGDNIYIGWSQTGTATINMTGGQVSSAGWSLIGGGYAPDSVLNLDGGTFTVPFIAKYPGTTLNIGGGTFIVDGDYLNVANLWIWDPCGGDWNGTLASPGVVKVYGANQGDIITDGNYPSQLGLRAVLVIDYDARNPGQTTATAGAVDPNKAWKPNPGNGAVDVSPYTVLSWMPGPGAVTHNLYLGTDFNDVNDRDPSVRTTVSDPCYVPGALELDATYYWAVDEVNNLADPNVYPGQIWSFTTQLIKAKVKLIPRALNINSTDKWITCHIQLPQEYDVADIDVDSILLEDEIPAERVWFVNEFAVVKFSRSALQELLADLDIPTIWFRLFVTGELNDGTTFEGTDAIRVIDKGRRE